LQRQGGLAGPWLSQTAALQTSFSNGAEDQLDIYVGLCAHLLPLEAALLGPVLGRAAIDATAFLVQIGFAGDHHDRGRLLGSGAQLLIPMLDILERHRIGAVIDNNGTLESSDDTKKKSPLL